MKIKQINDPQKIGDIEQGFNQVCLNRINDDLDDDQIDTSAEPDEDDNGGVTNPEIPSEGDPTPDEAPIIF